MSSISNTNGNFIVGNVAGDVTNNVNIGKQPTVDDWAELMTIASPYGKGAVKQLLDVQRLIEGQKTVEARPIWAKVRELFTTALPHAANIAQIVGVIDQLTRIS